MFSNLLFISFLISSFFVQIDTNKVDVSMIDVNGEILSEGIVFVEELNKTYSCNQLGYVTITLPSGSYHVVIYHHGYATQKHLITIESHSSFEYTLQDLSNHLNEVVIYDNGLPRVENSATIERIDAKKLTTEPLIFGEGDIIKKIQLSAGVKTIAEGSSSYFVRGGRADQNLILIDDATLYHIGHIYGYVSAINPDIIRSAKFHKTILPTNFENRLSSVLEIDQRHGNLDKFEAGIGLGTLTARAFVNTPIVKNKSSALVAFRKSTLDLFIKPSNGSFIPGFYDLNIKAQQKFNNKSQLFLTAYLGKDNTDTGEGSTQEVINYLIALKYILPLSDKLYINSSLNYSVNESKVDLLNGNSVSHLSTNLQSSKGKLEFDYRPNKVLSTAQIGVAAINYELLPGYVSENLDGFSSDAIEINSYLWSAWDLGLGISLNAGAKYSLFNNYTNSSTYQDPNSIEQDLTGSISISKRLYKHSVVSLGGSNGVQYIHQISSSAYGYSSLDYWILSNNNVRPQQSNNVLLSYNYDNEKISFGVSTYYRKQYNQLGYIENARIIDNPEIENEIIQGRSKAYGIELDTKFTISSKSMVSLQYAWSKVLMNIQGVNQDKTYPALHDIPHSMNAIYRYQISDRWSVSTNFVYQSGRVMTLANGYYYYNNLVVPSYEERNGSRGLDFHRLDVSANYQFAAKKSWIDHSVSFGIYNIYNRANHLGYTVTEGGIDAYKSFGILPFFNYQINFK
ncbi:MAG: TonB-dependent receptor [Reichenbachiella sp.]